MKNKEQIVADWLPRYTGMPIEEFWTIHSACQFFLITWKCLPNDLMQISTLVNMSASSAEDITIINFGMGSANAATIMDLLTAIQPKACLFLGKCGGTKKKNKVGDLILPIAAIRGEGTSSDYFPPEVPALPSFALQKSYFHKPSGTLRETIGQALCILRIVVSGNMTRSLKKYLRSVRCIGVDMETATLFSAGFHNKIPTGALLLVSDMPMIPEGVKTSKGDVVVTEKLWSNAL